MTLEQVLPAVRAGKQIRRSSWKSWRRIRLEKGRLLSSQNLSVLMYGADILADDWEIVE